MADRVIHSKPSDPYTVATHWDDEGFHIVVQADIRYGEGTLEEVEPDEVRQKIQMIAQLLTENIFRGTEFKRHVH